MSPSSLLGVAVYETDEAEFVRSMRSTAYVGIPTYVMELFTDVTMTSIETSRVSQSHPIERVQSCAWRRGNGAACCSSQSTRKRYHQTNTKRQAKMVSHPPPGHGRSSLTLPLLSGMEVGRRRSLSGASASALMVRLP